MSAPKRGIGEACMTSAPDAVDARDVGRMDLRVALVAHSHWPLTVIDLVTPRDGWVWLDNLDYLSAGALRLLASDIAHHATAREEADLSDADALWHLADCLDLLAVEVAERPRLHSPHLTLAPSE